MLIKGRVIARPPQMVRKNSETGEIEIAVTEFNIVDPNEEYIEEKTTESVTMDVDADIPTKPETKAVEKPRPNLFTYRTHHCGELNEQNIGEEVVLTGWLEYQRMRKFFTLRDGYGCTQVIIPDELTSQYNIDDVPFESTLKVTGLGMKSDVQIEFFLII